MTNLPNFLVVGAAKSGTTSLFKYLNTHPEIYRRSNFIYALIRSMDVEGYNHKQFIKMLKRYPSMLEAESTIPKYIRRIDAIYNKMTKNPKDVCPIAYANKLFE